MPNKKLIVFITKRVLICYILVSIIDIVLVEHRWTVLSGMFLGVAASLIRFNSYGIVFERIFLASSKVVRKGLSITGSMIIFTVNQLVLLLLLYVAYKFDPVFFAGILAGIMILPLMLFINCLTEAIGVTHNNFE